MSVLCAGELSIKAPLSTSELGSNVMLTVLHTHAHAQLKVSLTRTHTKRQQQFTTKQTHTLAVMGVCVRMYITTAGCYLASASSSSTTNQPTHFTGPKQESYFQRHTQQQTTEPCMMLPLLPMIPLACLYCALHELWFYMDLYCYSLF